MTKKPPPRRTQAAKSAKARPRFPWSRVVIGVIGAAVVVLVIISGGSTNLGEAQPFDHSLVAVGETLYAANCATCHGADLLGTDIGPPFLDPIYAPNHHGDEAFQQAAAFGVVPHHWNFGQMPPVPALTRDDVAKIVAFVRSEQQAAGIFRDPSHP